MFKNQAWTPTREVIQMKMVVDVQKEFQRSGQLIHPRGNKGTKENCRVRWV